MPANLQIYFGDINKLLESADTTTMIFYPKSLSRLTGQSLSILMLIAFAHACSSPSPAKVTRGSKVDQKNGGDASNPNAILVVELSNEAEITSAEVTGYRLVVQAHEGASCPKEPVVDRTGAWKSKNFTVQVPTSCSYYVGVELGAVTGQNTLAPIQFSNIDGNKKGWTVIQTDLNPGGIFKLIRRLPRIGEPDSGNTDPGGSGAIDDPEPNPTGRKLNLAREVLGFYSNTSIAAGMLSSQASLERDGDLIHILSPLWYTVNAQAMIQAEGGGPRQEALDQAKSKGTKVIPVVRNLGETNGFLASSTLQKKAQDNIINLIASNKYQGIHLWFDKLSAADKAVLTDFVNGLSTRLKTQKKMLIVSVPPKDDGGKNLNAAYDYAAISAVADRVVLQALDLNNLFTAAGPVAPLDWVKKNIDLAISAGVPASKLLLSIPTYGYEYTKTPAPTVKVLSVTTAQDYIIGQDGNLTGSHYRWDDTFASPVWDFTDRVIYLENAYAAQAKFIAANEKNVKGVAVWHLGSELPEFWSFLLTRLKK